MHTTDVAAVRGDDRAAGVAAVTIVQVSNDRPDAPEPLFFFTNPPTAATVAAAVPRPVYAVTPLAVGVARRAADSVPRAAEVYGTALARRQPTGPLHLLGHCVNGVIAFETARWLLARDREVRFLGLIDTMHPALFHPALPPLLSVIEPFLAADPGVAAAVAELELSWQERRLSPVLAIDTLGPPVRRAAAEHVARFGAALPSLRDQFVAACEAFLFLGLTTWLHRPAAYPRDVSFIYNTVGLNTGGMGEEYLRRSVGAWRDTVGGAFDTLVVDASGMEAPHDDLPGAPEVTGYLAARLT